MQQTDIYPGNSQLIRPQEWNSATKYKLTILYSYGLPIVNPNLDLALPLNSIQTVVQKKFLWQPSILLENFEICTCDNTQISWQLNKNYISCQKDTETGSLEADCQLPPVNRNFEMENMNKFSFYLNQEIVDSLTVINQTKTEKSKQTTKMNKFWKIKKKGKRIPIKEKLKMHPWDIQQSYNSDTKRINKVLTCLYDGCGKKFTKTWNIIDHFKVHTGLKPFSCKSWLREFSQKGNLTKHLKIHLKWEKYLKDNNLDLD